MFTRACRWVHPRSFARAPWGALTSSGIVGFIRVRPGCHWVHSRAFASLARDLGVVGYIRGRWVIRALSGLNAELLRLPAYATCVLGIVRFVRSCWIHSRAPWRSLGSSGDVRFARARRWGRCVHPGSLGSLGCVLGVNGFIWGSCVHSPSPRGSSCSSVVVGIARARAWGH